MATYHGPISYVERRLLMKISSLIICNIKLMAERKKGWGKDKGGREGLDVEFRDSLVHTEL